MLDMKCKYCKSKMNKEHEAIVAPLLGQSEIGYRCPSCGAYHYNSTMIGKLWQGPVSMYYTTFSVAQILYYLSKNKQYILDVNVYGKEKPVKDSREYKAITSFFQVDKKESYIPQQGDVILNDYYKITIL